MLDLLQIGQAAEKRRWIVLGGALAGVEIEIVHVGPRDQERFRQKMVSAGILRASEGGQSINRGREDDFFRSFAERYVTDWRGEIRQGDDTSPAYSPEAMGRVLGAYSVAFEQVTKALAEEADFFSVNGDGSTA